MGKVLVTIFHTLNNGVQSHVPIWSVEGFVGSMMYEVFYGTQYHPTVLRWYYRVFSVFYYG
jgi:hypothetical protein